MLLHPGVGDRRCWEEMILWLPDELTVIAFDLRGYLVSPSSPVPFTHLGDLMLLCDRVANTRSVWLIGSALGGEIALDAAAEDPDIETLGDELEAAVASGTMEDAETETRIWLDGTGPAGRVGGPARQLMLAVNRSIGNNDAPEDRVDLVWQPGADRNRSTYPPAAPAATWICPS